MLALVCSQDGLGLYSKYAAIRCWRGEGEEEIEEERREKTRQEKSREVKRRQCTYQTAIIHPSSSLSSRHLIPADISRDRINIKHRKSGLARGWEWPTPVAVGRMDLSCVLNVVRVSTDVERVLADVEMVWTDVDRLSTDVDRRLTDVDRLSTDTDRVWTDIERVSTDVKRSRLPGRDAID